MAKPKCTRCGRVLKDPVSIARGMGPVCAGEVGTRRQTRQARIHRRAGKRYAAHTGGKGQLFLFVSENKPLKEDKRRRHREIKTERRRCFETRTAFVCGRNAQTKEPVIYSPTPDGGWRNNEGYATTHENLEKYLYIYGWI